MKELCILLRQIYEQHVYVSVSLGQHILVLFTQDHFIYDSFTHLHLFLSTKCISKRCVLKLLGHSLNCNKQSEPDHYTTALCK